MIHRILMFVARTRYEAEAGQSLRYAMSCFMYPLLALGDFQLWEAGQICVMKHAQINRGKEINHTGLAIPEQRLDKSHQSVMHTVLSCPSREPF